MLLNISNRNKEIERKINTEVGESFSFAERVKFGGIGSPKLKILSSSIEIHNLLQIDQNTNTCNIELRPTGIIIRFQKRLESYALVIPYYRLSIFKGESNSYTFFKDNYKIKVLANEEDYKIHNFVKKVQNQKDSLVHTA